MNNIFEKYFDIKFKNTELKTISIGKDEYWYGFIKGNTLVLACPKEELKKGLWFYDGGYFLESLKLFDISGSEFSNKMKDYITERYPDLFIAYIM